MNDSSEFVLGMEEVPSLRMVVTIVPTYIPCPREFQKPLGAYAGLSRSLRHTCGLETILFTPPLLREDQEPGWMGQGALNRELCVPLKTQGQSSIENWAPS